MMGSKPFKFHVSRDYSFGNHGSFALYMSVGETHVAKGPMLVDIVPRKEVESELFEPLLRLSEIEAQSLLQGLWDQGLRPNNGEGSQANIEALKAHLEDMREIVFGHVFPPRFEITSYLAPKIEEGNNDAPK